MSNTAPSYELKLIVAITAICFLPTLLYLVMGLYLVPHQIVLFLSAFVPDSLVVIFYFVGAYAGTYAAYVMLHGEWTGKYPAITRRRMQRLIWLGLIALGIGPAGSMLYSPGEPLIVAMSAAPTLALAYIAHRNGLFASDDGDAA